jgi:hypothetical protein
VQSRGGGLELRSRRFSARFLDRIVAPLDLELGGPASPAVLRHPADGARRLPLRRACGALAGVLAPAAAEERQNAD